MPVIHYQSGGVRREDMSKAKTLSSAVCELVDEYCEKKRIEVRGLIGGGFDSHNQGGGVLHAMYLVVKGGVRPMSLAEIFVLAEKCKEDPFRFLVRAIKRMEKSK